MEHFYSVRVRVCAMRLTTFHKPTTNKWKISYHWLLNMAVVKCDNSILKNFFNMSLPFNCSQIAFQNFTKFCININHNGHMNANLQKCFMILLEVMKIVKFITLPLSL